MVSGLTRWVTDWGSSVVDGLMLVGEQPGDHEDLQGKPFVGPAGQLLRSVMGGIGLDPGTTYITNVVKHFKFEPRGNRRLHKNPTPAEIEQCQFWVLKEIELVAPRIIVAMGGSAYRGLTGEEARVGQMRGRPMIFGQGRRKCILSGQPEGLLPWQT